MLNIYGVPNSQPVRAVVWTCLVKKLPFELIMTSQNIAAKQPDYLSKVNPRGTIPAIDDAGLILWESNAILIYLAEKHGWTDIWPTDLLARARVNQYLHFHHRNTRELVAVWSRTLWPSLFDIADPDENWFRRNTFPAMENNAEIVRNTLEIVDGMLAADPFLAGTTYTIADICAYEELGQNQAKYANCIDYNPYPNIQRWFLKMEQLPFHDEAHSIWAELGDLNKISGGMKTLAKANKETAAIWRALMDQ